MAESKLVPRQIADPSGTAPIGAVLAITGPDGQTGFAELAVVINAADSITFTPPLVSVPADSPEGVFLSTPSISAVDGGDAVYSLVNDTGVIALSGGNVVTGPIKQDYSIGGTYNQKIRVDFDTNKKAIETTVTLGVTAPTGHSAPTVDANFVTGYYAGCFLNDFYQTQADPKTEPDSTGALDAFGVNEKRINDIGWHFSSLQQKYVFPHALQPSLMTFQNGSGAGTFVLDLTLAGGVFQHPAKLTTAQHGNDMVAQAMDLTGFAAGDWVTIMTAWKKTDATDIGFFIKTWSATAAQGDGYSFPNVTNPAATNPVNLTTFGADGPYMHVLSYRYDAATGICYASCTYQIRGTDDYLYLGTSSDDARAYSIGLLGAQVVNGQVEVGWRDTGATQEGTSADVLGVTDGTSLANIVHAATGWIGIEVQDLQYNSTSMEVIGDLLKVGATGVIHTTEATAYQANGVDAVVGYGGLCGIARFCLTWDATGWECWCNYSGDDLIKASGAGAWSPGAGAIEFASGLSGRIRRLSGGIVKLTSAEAKDWSSLLNRPFARPMDAQLPGMDNAIPRAMHQTKYDGYDVDPLLRRSAWTGIVDSTGLSNLYNADKAAHPERYMIPRSFFYGHSALGTENDEIINGEMEMYWDPDWVRVDSPANAADIPRVAWQENSTLNIQVFASDDPAYPNLLGLTPEDIASRPDYVAGTSNGTPGTGTPLDFASAMLTSFNADDTKGFFQRFGDFEWRAKLPVGPGYWGAIWMYTQAQNEIDVIEYYAINSQQLTGAVHANSFGNNNGYVLNEPGVIGDRFHSWGFRWRNDGTGYSWYFDGKQSGFVPRNTGFAGGDMTDMDSVEMFILYNVAINRAQAQPHLAELKAIANAHDERSIMRVDRFQAHQYGIGV